MFTKQNSDSFTYSERLKEKTFLISSINEAAKRHAASNTGLVIRFRDKRQFAGNIFFENFQKRYLSSETKREAVSAEERWAIGLIDGDGHIGMECSNAKLQKWVPCLKVTLKAYNARAIYRLKKILGIGSITRSGNYISLRVRKLEGWKKLLTLFEKFPLRTDKYYAVEMVKKSLLLLQRARAARKGQVFLAPFYPEENIRKSERIPNSLSVPDREAENQCLLYWKLDLKAKQGKLSPVWVTLLPFLSPLNSSKTIRAPDKREKPADKIESFFDSSAILFDSSAIPDDFLDSQKTRFLDSSATLRICKETERVQSQKNLLEVSLNPKSVFDNCDQFLLEQVVDLHWLAGFVEANGSFYILQDGQHGFAIGQAYNTLVIAGIHKRLNIKASLKIRSDFHSLKSCPYAQSETKDKATLLRIGNLLKGKILGIKSFIFSLWLRTLRKNDRLQSQKARTLIKKITQRIA